MEFPLLTSLHLFIMRNGAIEKGNRGELFSRLSFTLAHNSLMCQLESKQ